MISNNESLPTATAVLLCIVLPTIVFLRFFGARAKFRAYELPPGPPKLPFIGNILQIPQYGAWETFSMYKEIYGDILYFEGFGNSILVLNSLEAMNDLLDKRGNNYSHRPIFVVAGELMGLGRSMPLLPYGEEWRVHRKLAHLALSPTAVKAYRGVQEDLAVMLCDDLLKNPDDFFSSVRLTAGRIIISVTYGLPVGSSEDEYITHAEKTMDIIGKAIAPGAFLCDLIPALKHLPTWVPFHQKALEGRAMIERLVTRPFEHVKSEISAGTASPSLAHELLTTRHHGISDFEYKVMWTTGAMYGAGAETTFGTVITFIMAMVLNPSIQRRAQAEIDSVIGAERLPTISDAPNLPYVRAVIKETMRWSPVLPISLPRRTDGDDVYKNFFIPKGTIVIPNVYSIALSSTKKYSSKDFVPERFLDSDENAADPGLWVFGFGRRICPGRHLAENSVFILIATILSVFEISPSDEETFTPKFTQSTIRYPEPFKCSIAPRNEALRHLVRQRAAQCSEGGKSQG